MMLTIARPAAAHRAASTSELMAAVESTRPAVARLLASRGNADVDDVLQATREVLWHKVADREFDPARGTLGGLAYGIALRLARRVLSRTQLHYELFDQATSDRTALDALVEDYELTRFLEALADLLGVRDWTIVAACALEHESTKSVAADLHLSERTVQDVRAWALTAAAALWKGFAAADADEPATAETIIRCVSDHDRIGQVLPHTFDEGVTGAQVAALTGIPEVEARRALPRARRLRHALAEILEQR